MKEFEKALLRLKEQLNVATDKDAAEKLGLGEKALNARKSRDSFPIKEVFALAASNPELGIDPDWIVTGTSKHFETQDMTERHLVECYRVMTSVDKKTLTRVAAALSGVATSSGNKEKNLNNLNAANDHSNLKVAEPAKPYGEDK